MRGWVALIIVLVIVGIFYYTYSKSNGFSGILSSIGSSSPSIQQIDANPNGYLGKQVTIDGTLYQGDELSNGTQLWFIQDSQGFNIDVKLPNQNGRSWMSGAKYSINGIVAEVLRCTCRAAANLPPLSLSNVGSAAECTSQSTSYQSCNASYVYYVDVTSATEQT